jgi:hypothetical protein
VLLNITYLLMRWTFDLAVLMFRGDQAKNAELLVLRHENASCAGTLAGYGTSQVTGPGLPRSRGSSPGGAGHGFSR